MEDYKPNSNLSKRQNGDGEQKHDRKVEKVISSDVTIKKKSGFKKFLSTFIHDDAESVGSYLFSGILIPALQKTLLDLINNGSEMMILGPNAKRDRKRTPASYVSYRGYYDDRRDDYRDRDRRDRGYSFDLEEIILPTRADAEAVLMGMDDTINRYDGIVTVAELYDLIGQPAPHTANKYGWTNLRSASIIGVREGFLLRLPKPMPID